MIDSSARVTARARERFLSVGRLPEGAVVRPEIVASWRRSLLYGLSPTAALPTGGTRERAETQLARVAHVVVERRRGALAGLRGGVTLTDREGHLLDRWVEDSRFARWLDRRNVVLGACVSEMAVGTNSCGLSVETGLATMVIGHEHFSEGAVMMTTAGAPIRHPLTRRLVGSLNVTCVVEDTHPLLLPWILELVEQIESRLLESVSDRQRILLDAYLTSSQDARHPVVCLDSQTVITNAAAARLLGAEDQATLWELAARTVARSMSQDVRLDLSTGHQVDVGCSPVVDGDRPVGAVLRLTRVPPEGTMRGGEVPVGLPGLVGSSRTWCSFVRDLRSAARDGSPLLLIGEPGTGKLAAARSVTGEADEAIEIDAPTVAMSGPAAWMTALEEGASADVGALILRRIDALDASTFAAMVRFLSSVALTPLRVMATARANDGAVPAELMDWPGHVVTSPPLRERLDDLASLLAVFTARLSGNGGVPRWSAEALQALSRVPWPANMHSLIAVVRDVLAGHPGPLVRTVDLPPQTLARGTRRLLSGLEQVEAHAIISALRRADSNKREAAQDLGISRSTLYRKLRALGLDLDTAAF